MSSQTNPNQILQDVFGYSEFRLDQARIISKVMAKENTLAIMPTGGGKSLCYQVPALMNAGLTLVISPLISLMQDQVRQLRTLDIPACMLNSALSTEAYRESLELIQHQQCKLVFLAPETALQPDIITLLGGVELNLIAIDEAHCISEWGHEFRPEYRQLQTLIQQFPEATIIALTATATPRVRDDIRRQLSIHKDHEFVSSFDRTNLFIEVVPKGSGNKSYQQIVDYIDKHKDQSGIIYCQSRSGVDELTDKLRADGYKALAYHAGLTALKRSSHQEKFVVDDVDIVVATIAFGMGINKPDVRFVIHADLPKNIESYYQQIGRAGRDGLAADCLLLFSYGDSGKVRYFIDQMAIESERRLATLHLQQMLSLAETQDCRRLPLLKYFGENPQHQNCKNCDNCVSEKQEKQDLSVAAQKFLSCVIRTGQRFGAAYIVDVLRGSNAEKVLQNQHNLLSTYDIGKEYSKKQWMALARQLMQAELLHQDPQFGGLSLTAKAADVLGGRVPFFALLQEEQSSASNNKHQHTLIDCDQVLLNQLKAHRKALADQQALPPYAIFADRSLQEMAHFFPQSLDTLLKIHGVGKAKADHYGESFIAIIVQYCQENKIEEKDNSASVSSSQKTSKRPGLGDKTRLIVKDFEAGFSIEGLIHKHNLKDSTIYNHLYRYVDAGQAILNKAHLRESIKASDEQLDIVCTVFDEHGTQRLKPAYDALQESVAYSDIHLMRVWYLSKQDQ